MPLNQTKPVLLSCPTMLKMDIGCKAKFGLLGSSHQMVKTSIYISVHWTEEGLSPNPTTNFFFTSTLKHGYEHMIWKTTSKTLYYFLHAFLYVICSANRVHISSRFVYCHNIAYVFYVYVLNVQYVCLSLFSLFFEFIQSINEYTNANIEP